MTPEDQLHIAKFGLSNLEVLLEGWVKANKEFDVKNTQTEMILDIVREIQANMR